MQKQNSGPNEEAQAMINLLNKSFEKDGEVDQFKTTDETLDVSSHDKQEILPTSEQKNFTLPEESNTIGVGVKSNLKTHQVVVTIGSKSIAFSIADARGLALALRQNANFVERHGN